MGCTRAVNITDVARKAGVSIATVSRVLNNTGGYPVKTETRERVLSVVEELGYRPNDLARGLLSKKSRTIGLLIPDISNPYYPELSLGIEATASENGYSVIFCNTSRRAEKLEHYVDVLLQKRADGIIIAGGGTDFAPVLRAMGDFELQVTVIGRHGTLFPSIQVDNVAAANRATSHLLELGHQRVAFISGPLNLASAQDRLEGYKLALERLGGAKDECLVREGDFQYESGYTRAMSLLRDSDPPTAIFTANDRMAIGAISAAMDLGLNVPDELSVVGFDDIAMARYVRPTLTTVSLSDYEMGVSSMQSMLRQLRGEEVPEVTWMPTELMIRQSTGPAPGLARPEITGLERGGDAGRSLEM